MTCLITYKITGSCTCGTLMNPCHTVNGKLYCASCCPEHGEANHEWTAGDSAAGEQGSLFVKEREYPE